MKDRNWRFFDDDKVTMIENPERFIYENSNRNAYLLFYNRRESRRIHPSQNVITLMNEEQWKERICGLTKTFNKEGISFNYNFYPKL